MKPADIFDAPAVRQALAQLEQDLVVSDILDDEGHQYVDLVMEGGGVLGIALLGYVYALEEAGIRFLGVGGTSAGAINALLTAAADIPSRAKSPLVVKCLTEMDMWSFVDGDDDAREFVQAMAGGAGPIKLFWRVLQVFDSLSARLGMNPGDAFLSWLETTLRGFGVQTMRDLQAKMEQLPPLRRRSGEPLPPSEAAPQLAIVTADVTTETKVVFPDMAALYWEAPETLCPAHFVRASMSIPFFFEPYRVRNIPQGPTARQRWKERAGYNGTLPAESLFLDGGIMSNFPINLFHSPGVPLAPTLGVKLGVDRSSPRQVSGPLKVLSAMLDSARHSADFDFLFKHPDYSHLIAHIETGPHGWLQFDLDWSAKLDLFARGVKAAVDFLNTFDWAAYKEVRSTLAKT